MTSITWAEFAQRAPEIAEAGRRRLVGDDGVAIAFLATVTESAVPHLGPVCPVFCDDGLYLSGGAATPKVRDLRSHGRYVLHAFLGANDEEFQVAGAAVEVRSSDERARVHAAIPFPSFERDDPIFRFGVERALWVHWENVGEPDTRPVRRRWVAD